MKPAASAPPVSAVQRMQRTEEPADSSRSDRLRSRNGDVHHGQHRGVSFRSAPPRAPRAPPPRPSALAARSNAATDPAEDSALHDSRLSNDRDDDAARATRRELGDAGATAGDERARETYKPLVNAEPLEAAPQRFAQVRLGKPRPVAATLRSAASSGGAEAGGLRRHSGQAPRSDAVATPLGTLALTLLDTVQAPCAAARAALRRCIAETAVVPQPLFGLREVNALLREAVPARPAASSAMPPAAQQNRYLLLPLQLLVAALPRDETQRQGALARLDMLALAGAPCTAPAAVAPNPTGMADR